MPHACLQNAKHKTQVARARENAEQLQVEDAKSFLELGAGNLLLAQADVARAGGIPLPSAVCDRLVCDLPFGKQVLDPASCACSMNGVLLMLVHEWRALDARHVGCEHFLACLLAVGGPDLRACTHMPAQYNAICHHTARQHVPSLTARL